MLMAVLCALKWSFEVRGAHQLLQSAHLHIHPLHFLRLAADALHSALGSPPDVCTWSNCCMSHTPLLTSFLPRFAFLCPSFAFAFQIVTQQGRKCPSGPTYNPHVKLPLVVPLLSILHGLFTFPACFTCTATAAWKNFSSNPYVVRIPLLIESSQKTGLLRRKAKVLLSHSCKQIHTKIWWSF